MNARQPWALKEAKVTELTDEQKEFMAQIQKEKDEQGGGEHLPVTLALHAGSVLHIPHMRMPTHSTCYQQYMLSRM